jgi:hypothetical protein
MSLPVKANLTCDIYRFGRSPPSSPDVPGVPCYLRGSYYAGLEHGEGDPTNLKYSHVMLVDVNTDVRDAYNLGQVVANASDSVFIPAGAPSGTAVQYVVIFVERHNRGTSQDHKRVYLSRGTVSNWTANQDF